MTTAPTCPLPGCTNPTTQPGAPCRECLDAFGSYLAPAPPRAVPATAEQITAELAARDRGIAAAYTMQAATEVAATTTERPAYEACRTPARRTRRQRRLPAQQGDRGDRRGRGH